MGSPVATSLWESNNLEDWRKVVGEYYDILRDHKVFELEKWYQQTLPSTIKAQEYLTKEQGIKLIQWKGTRGKFRPALVKYAKDQDDAALRERSKEAYQILASVKDAECINTARIMEALCKLTLLRGVGPATASAILSAIDPRVPFMSDEALLVCLGKREYTEKAYRRLIECMQDKYKEITDANGGPHDLTLRDMEAALFASSIQDSTPPEQHSRKKRKVAIPQQ
jgi:hypothetical protein